MERVSAALLLQAGLFGRFLKGFQQFSERLDLILALLSKILAVGGAAGAISLAAARASVAGKIRIFDSCRRCLRRQRGRRIRYGNQRRRFGGRGRRC